MKKSLVAVLVLLSAPSAYADGYAIVDANGNQIGGVIACDAATCGNPDSLYSRLTLKPGERYVLQSKSDSAGNVAGINPSETTKPTVDIATNTWTVAVTQKVEVIPDVNVEVTTKRTFNPITEPTPTPEPIEPGFYPISNPTPTPSLPETTTNETSTTTTELNADGNTTVITDETEQTETEPEPFSEAWWAWLVAILRDLFGLDL